MASPFSPWRAALAALLLALCWPLAAWAAPAAYVPGEVLVHYREGAHAEGLRAAAGALLPRLRRLRLPPSESVPEALERLAGDPAVAWAEPNYEIAADAAPLAAEEVWPSEGVAEAPGLWGLARIGAPRAWELATGSPEVVVAVVDSGIDLSHPELSGNLYRNPRERLDGADEDGNGYTDDVCGWDFVENDADPADGNGHGTFVAGLIGAVGDNGAGGALGVCWRVSLLPLRVMDDQGRGDVATAVEAIGYAVRAGARVINLSWGAAGKSKALEEALEAAQRAGVLVVCSAGNDGQDTDLAPHYPSCYGLPNIVSVAASAASDALTPSSNWGAASVALAAPGQGLLSTAPGGGYAFGSGTSYAAALVSGVAALILSYDGYRGLPLAELRSRLVDGAERVPALSGRLASGGRLSAGTALYCLAPRRAVVRLGELLCFHLPGGCEGYGWALSEAAVGTIERGEFRAAALGRCQVLATPLGGGDVLSAAIEVVAEDGQGGGGETWGGGDAPAAQSVGGESGGGCFIATAAWGTPKAPEVAALRRLRDRCLLTSRPGRALVALYYALSPPPAAFLRQQPLLRPHVRLVLRPLAWLAGLTTRPAPAWSGLLLAAAALSLAPRWRRRP